MIEPTIGVSGAPLIDESEMSTNKILLKRWPDHYTVVGSPIQIWDIDEASEILAQNQWMQNWLAQKIKEALLSGEMFTRFGRVDDGWRGRTDGVLSEWRLASKKEVLDYVDTNQFATLTGHAISKRAQERGFTLHYHEGADLIKFYDALPRQAKVVLDLLNSTGRENFTEASIEVILTENITSLKTKQDPMGIFGFYRRRLIEEGHLEETENV